MSVDPIGSASAHLVSYIKLVADTLWEVQQSAPSPVYAKEMGVRLAASADEMARLVRAIPDFALILGPRDDVDARLRAGEAEQDALSAQLELSITAGEAALVVSNASIYAALVAALDSESEKGGNG